ncbi:MAG TPA: S66 peptidase family protein [Euzebyales bacterium]|nr:S66 peptidase family protein [Euzebyales bacterium]
MRAEHLAYPPKPAPGDRVAVLSPSAGLPQLFPAPFDLGLRRLRHVFGVEPVEYPTTRVLGASVEARARDIHAAFADPGIAAIVTSVGGEDQITVLRHLDPDVLRANPKPFFGYSDNTNLLHYLWNLGIVSYHGGAVMVQWGRPGVMQPETRASLERAMFTNGEYELPMPAASTDEDRDWASPDALEEEPTLQPAPPWSWHGPVTTVSGPAWGGCLEIVDFQLRASRYLGEPAGYAGAVLFLETSEEQPSASYVYRVLMCMGERGLLEQFPAVLMGRPKAWSFEAPNDADTKAAYRERQHEAVLRAVQEYNPDAVVVLDVDLGHTDPQVVIPHGGRVVVDAQAQRITVTY